MTSEVMHTSDGPTNPRTRRVKNRQVNLGSFTPHTVSPMQHLQAVIIIVRKSKPLCLCFSEQVSEPHPRTQMSDRPTHSSHTFYWRQNYCYTVFSIKSKDAGAMGKKSSSSLVFQYIKVNL